MTILALDFQNSGNFYFYLTLEHFEAFLEILISRTVTKRYIFELNVNEDGRITSQYAVNAFVNTLPNVKDLKTFKTAKEN